MPIDPTLKAMNERVVRQGDHDAPALDPEMQEIQWEMSAPLAEVYPDEFEQYLSRFFKFFPRSPCHVRYAYGKGFLCQKGKRKDGSEYDRPCHADMLARMLDLERWQHNHPNAKFPEYFWVAMREPKRSSLKAIDLDNKENVLGHYQTREMGRLVTRPLPVLSVEQMQKIKRVYDAFPNHIWCVSSATLGLHIWEKLPSLQPLNEIERRTRAILARIGLDNTEVHPMPGRPFRRPFGQDYFTITQDGPLDDWREQMQYFEDSSAIPNFEAIFMVLRELVRKEWSRFLYDREPGKVRISSPDPVLKGFIARANYFSMRDLVLEQLDQWMASGCPLTALSVESTTASPALTKQVTKKAPTFPPVSFNGKWIQWCRSWADHGLPKEDSIFLVVSNLAVWFFFVEFYETQENDRIDRIIDLLTQFCLTKHNGFITRLTLGQKKKVIDHVRRIVQSALGHVDLNGEQLFARIRTKRESGGYSKVLFLEPLILQGSAGPTTGSSSSSVVLTECCSVLNSPKPLETSPQNWVFEPDDRPLPKLLDEAIQSFYKRTHLKMNQPTKRKIGRFINFIRSKGGEARLSVKALKKIGFSNHAARQHIKNLERIGVIATEGYCPAAHISKLYRLTDRAMQMFAEDGP